MKYQVTVAGRSFDIEVDHDRLVRVNGRPLYVELEQVGGLPIYSLTLDDRSHLVFVEEGDEQYRVEVQGRVYTVDVAKQRPRLASRQVECSDSSGDCLAVASPLAGHLVALLVAPGDRVEAGQAVAIVESMKMQIEIKAPQPAIVEVVHGPAGRKADQGEELVRLRTEP